MTTKIQKEIEIEPVEESIEPKNILAHISLSENFVEAAAKQIELRARLLRTALKALKPHDIQDFEGKPYIEGEGAARIMSVIRGFKVDEARFQIEQIHPHYFVECSVPIEFMGATTVALGDCSTADPFFVGKDGKGGLYAKHLERTGSETIAARLILGDAKKKARENAVSRGVTELLGLKGLSWKDLGELGFLRAEAGAKIAFKSGSQDGEIKTLSVSDAIQAAKGSMVNVRGGLLEMKEKNGVSKNGKSYKITHYLLTDNANKIWVGRFGSPLSLIIGSEVFAEKVGVSEYQGEKRFMAENLTNLGEEVPPNGSEHQLGD